MPEIALSLHGRHLEAAWWGQPAAAAPTLVLLHEGLGSVGLWRDFPARLAAATGLPVFAYSRFGYGRSATTALPRPLAYMHDEAATLKCVLDAAGIRSCILIGHSDGASIAAIYAGSTQDFRVLGLILIAPHFFAEDISITSITAARHAYTNGDLRLRLARHHTDVDAAFLGWNGAWLDPAFRAWDITDHLPYIRVPILLLQGEADPYGTTAQITALEAATTCPVETILFPNIGHAPHQETAAALPAMTGFIHHIMNYNAQSSSPKTGTIIHTPKQEPP